MSINTLLKNRIFVSSLSVTILLLIYLLLGIGSMSGKSLTFDEGIHLTSGYSYWLRNDFRLQPESGVLIQRYEALPLVLMNINFPGENTRGWKQALQYLVADEFFYSCGNNPVTLIFCGRIMNLLLGVLLGVLIYFWSRELFGGVGGIISLVLFAFSPTVFASARLCTSDLAMALAFTATLWASWRMFGKLTPWRLAACSLSLAVLFMVKYSAVLIVPVYLIMLAVRIVWGGPLVISGFGKRRGFSADRKGMILSWLLGAGVVNALVIWLCIWSAYGFRYSMINHDQAGRKVQDAYWQVLMEKPGLTPKVVGIVRKTRILPEAYLYGFTFTWRWTSGRTAYLNGEIRKNGWWYFFPYCFIVKTPVPLLLLLLILLGAVIHRIFLASKTAFPGAVLNKLYPSTPLITLLVVYFGMAMASSLNIGVRHILPCYPLLMILAGFGGRYFREKTGNVMRWIVLLLLAAYVAVSLNAYPDYLAFFNSLAGGKEQGYRHLVDSSLDWGQDLPALRKWLDANRGDRPVYVSYFGTSMPEQYLQNVRLLPCYLPRGNIDTAPLEEGIYAISATMLQLTFFPELAQWDEKNENTLHLLEKAVQESGIKNQKRKKELARRLAYYRFGKLVSALRKREPEANIGGSILIYRLSAPEVMSIMSNSR